jgi:hypothetical protein
MTTENATPTDSGTPNPAAGANAGAAPEGTVLTPDQGNAAAAGTEGSQSQSADGAQGSEDKGSQGDEPKAPESYEFKMPDGVELDSKAADEFTAIAKELKLSQADAQRIADVAARMQQKQAETHVEMVKGWADQCKTDKEFGGDNLQQNMSVARKAIDTFGSPELKALLNNTGMGNHPEVVRFAFKAGKAISEDGFVQSGSRTPTPDSSLEKRLYPNMN